MNRDVLDPAERVFFEKLQTLLNAKQVLLTRRIRRICGVDAAYSDNGTAVAVASCFDTRNGSLVEQCSYSGRVTFPYAPGLLFFREGPFVVESVNRLNSSPDLICFDGQGIAHPRRKGLATICGMLLGKPAVGIAKSKLVGDIVQYKPQLDKLLAHGRDCLGYVTYSPRRFWSPGFSVSTKSLESIIRDFGGICLKAIAESHSRANSLLNSREGLV
jgi:deoxyinosine 3'endonuclease (endonuclease V)